MTKDDDDTVQQLFHELSCDDTQQQEQQQKPFQIVLVDIEKTAKNLEIHCVEKPLEGNAEELNFVALSYRWGEVHETTIDTQLDYLATITSFDLEDFYSLCSAMTYEPDLKSIKYVWVDAICVDQTNYARRKATIHQMSNIYEKATYILAVPDLHLRYLMIVYEKDEKLIRDTYSEYSDYIYHLIQGNTEQLHTLDKTFLDKTYAPKDSTLRELLANYTTYLANGFTAFQDHHDDMDYREGALDLLCEIYEASLPESHESRDHVIKQTQKTPYRANKDNGDESLLDYDKVAQLMLTGPCYSLSRLIPERRLRHGRAWAHALIRRRNSICRILKFFEDIIKDWSSRVWVISEYNIAKKKNNLKYWFLQLSSSKTESLPFFKFDFTNPAFSSAVQNAPFILSPLLQDKNPVHLLFHRLIIKQLNSQSFFEMMLKSKASRNEDRFYAVLPQSKYKDKVNQVADWNISNMISVKFKLFEIMDNKDKWILLFFAGHYSSINSYQVLPTFCASNIDLVEVDNFIDSYPREFDTYNASSAITLHHNDDLRLDYLQLTPKKYYVTVKQTSQNFLPDVERQKRTLYHRLQLDQHSSVIDFVYIPYYDDAGAVPSDDTQAHRTYYSIALFGSFEHNKWILSTPEWNFENPAFVCHNNDDNAISFHLY
ncbi:hypothetical protein BCR42DRAFT_472729 [Absidia repens]|uniref:Heterokaryon incompatibility domain-containing protein n=1 Tax=Absidia repens TaxID=90262 RepID=A0A1X2I076_9FUNG|nr:hypothetical protein BCR42DRAFT_472729 [Absidia repens]